MEPRRLWWQQIKKHPLIVAEFIVVIFALTALAIAVSTFGWDWTGFNGGYGKITIHTSTKDTELPPARTLWDWLELLAALAIPVVVGFGAVWFTTRQGKVSEARNKQQHDTELQITVDNQRETALQAYIDKISELLLKEHLGEIIEDGKLKPKYEQVRKIARVRTLTVLPRLDARRKRRVLRFLYESDLIEKNNSIIDLGGANLRETDLREAYLPEVDLSMADLRGADLCGADLRGVDLRGAKMNNETDLSGTKLQGAEYNMKGIQKQVRLEKYDTIEPTQWPQEFNFRAAKAICVDCVSVSLIVFTPQGPITIKTEVTASATFTDLGSSDPHKADWVWGDNTLPTPGTVTESNGSGSVSDSHTYTSAGSYYVQITITNNDGGIANSQSHINVDNPDLHKTIHILQLD